MAFAAVLPTLYLTQAYGRWSATLWTKIAACWNDLMGLATQAITNIRTVRAFGTEPHELQAFDGYLSYVFKLDMMESKARMLNTIVNSYFDAAVGAFILWYGGSVIISGEDAGITFGEIVTFQLYWNMMKNAFQGLSSVLTEMLRCAAATQNILDLLSSSPTIDSHGGRAVEPTQVRGSLSLQGVVFSYPAKHCERPAVNGFSLELPAGTTTAVVGRSGSGKSTLMALLLRMYDPCKGQISLDGEDIRLLQPWTLRKCFGLVAQETQLFAGTIEDNIAYGLQKHEYSVEELDEAAKCANVQEFLRDFDEGYSALVGDRGIQLSGGQRQRIAIARVFLRRSRVLLLDEATSALDTENEAQVQQALDRLVSSGVCSTVLVIAHRLSTVINATQIAVMHEGSLVELGSHTDLLQRGERYKSLVDKQLQSRLEG